MSIYEEKSFCKKPIDENCVIWRYMDFTKFVSLLHKRALFFATIGKLLSDDPFEGTLSRPSATIPASVAYKELPLENQIGLEIVRQKYPKEFQQLARKFIVVNCWHINKHESVAMWRLFSSYNAGIAIKSSFQRLANSFVENELSPRSNLQIPVPVWLGEVEYRDYMNDFTRYGNVPKICLQKHVSFAHENELRAIACLPSDPKTDDLEWDLDSQLRKDYDGFQGVFFPVDLNALIEKVYVAPAAEWLKEIIESILDKHGINVEVLQSDLLNGAIY